MCGVTEYPVTTNPFSISRGVQHLWHTARNEAIAKGGKGAQTWTPVPASVILKVYLAPLVAARFYRKATRLASRNSSYSRLISCARDSSVVLETHQLYSKD